MRKHIHVSDGVKVKTIYVAQVMPVATQHRKTDQDLDRLFEHSDKTEEREKVQQEFLIEFFSEEDHRTRNSNAAAAIKKKLEALLEQGVFPEVKAYDIPADAVVLPSRMVYAIKNAGTNEELYKARLVAGGHHDYMKKLMTHHIASKRHASVRTLVWTAAILNCTTKHKDSVKSYIQATKMSRYYSATTLWYNISLKPVPEFNLPADTLLQILKYMYGLSESGDAWGVKLKTSILQLLMKTESNGDHALYLLPSPKDAATGTKNIRFEEDAQDDATMEQHCNAYDESDKRPDPAEPKTAHDSCNGLLGTYVDDSITAVDDDFNRETDKCDNETNMKKAVEPPATFAGLKIENGKHSDFVIHQADYIKGIDIIPLNSTFEVYRSQRHKPAGLATSRPDILAATNRFSHKTTAAFNVYKVKEVNKVIKYTKRTVDCKLRYEQLDMEKAEIIVFSDGSHATNPDSS